MKGKIIRAGPQWVEFEEVLRSRGIVASRTVLTDSVAKFIQKENLIDVMVNRAKRKTGKGLFE